MPSRRQFLTLAGVAAAAGCSTASPDRPVAAGGLQPVTQGSVTNPTGSVNGNSLTGLLDAYADAWAGILEPVGAAMAQGNYYVLLSDHTDACSRVGQPFAANEVTLRFVQVYYAPLPLGASPWVPAADLPCVFTVGQPLTTSDGVIRQITPYFNKANSSGGQGKDVAPTGGTVTFTAVDPATGQHEGSYDLTFARGGTAAGAFLAPWCGPLPS
jgi:hypothetical protein